MASGNMARIGTIAFAAALVLALILPAPALAADPVTKTYTYTSAEGQPGYDDEIDVDGTAYRVSGTSTRVISSEKEKRAAGKSETKVCAPDQLEATRASFPATVTFDEEGVKGEIPLKDISEASAPALVTYECNRSAVYSGLPDNDVSRIPMTASFTGDTGNAVELALAGISWTVTSVDSYGIPTGYTASCIYRGVDSYPVVDHYEVTATYEGEIETGKTVETYELTVEYEAKSAEDPVLGVVAASGAGVVTVGVAIAFFYRRRRFRITEERNGKERTLTKVKIVKDSGGIAAKVPASILIDPIDHFGYPPARYVKQGVNLTIYYSDSDGRDVVFYDSPAKDRIPLRL